MLTNGAIDRLVQALKKAMKALLVSWIHSQWLASFLELQLCLTPLLMKHQVNYSYRGIKDTNKSVWAEQAKEKSHHDSLSKSCEYFVGKKVLEYNFGIGPH